MIETIKRIGRIVSVTALFLFLPLNNVTLAEEAGSTAPTDGPSYVYVAHEGDSLSRIARHSLQLYQQANKLTLEPSRAIYCEASISQSLGNIRLEVGQHVEITMQAVQQCISQSRTLSADDLAGWQAYASQVYFDTSDLQPIAGQTTPGIESAVPEMDNTHDSMTPTQPASPADSAPTETKAPDQPVEAAKTAPATNPAKKFTVPKWWYAAAGGLIVLFFLFGDNISRRRRV